MMPNLVEYEKFFKKKQIIPIKPEIIKPKINQIDTTSFLFNIVAIIGIFIGLYFLMIRNEEKEKNKKKYNQDIENFTKKVKLD